MKQCHNSYYQFILLLVFVFLGLISKVNAQGKTGRSEWVRMNEKGKLQYKSLPAGDKIMDFSYAGYKGGGVKIPSPAVAITLSPMEGDNTNHIQDAINELAKSQLVNGLRGVLLLKPGIYNCERTISINESGIILRGSGSGESGTIINMTGKPHVCISVRGRVVFKKSGISSKLADSDVSSGSFSFNVTNVQGFNIGDTIRITKPVTDAWVRFMGMDEMVRNYKKQTWITGEITTDRVIKKITDKHITVDIPLTDNYDSKYLNPPGVAV